MILKLNAGRFKAPVEFLPISEKRLRVKFRFNRRLITEIKSMRGARWHPEEKHWTIEDCQRNWFNINYLVGENVYEKFDQPVSWDNIKSKRPLYDHQKEWIAMALQIRQHIFAGEMGTGKTISAIEVMERSEAEVWWWVGVGSSILAVEAEFFKWGLKTWPVKIITYGSLRRILEEWPSGKPAPEGIVFDESSKIKNETTQRSQAARALTESMFKDHKNPYVILMSGTTAPKDPSDWWNQSETTCPGFIKEGNQKKLKNSLALIKTEEGPTGQIFPKLITWWDDKNKCAECGQLKSNEIHDPVVLAPDYHDWRESSNEVYRLYKRLKGLVTIKFKKDCLDLPEKIYKKILLKPSAATMRAARIIAAKSPRAITALSLLRQLSDGFQYEMVKVGEVACELCHGSGNDPHEEGVCPQCTGSGKVAEMERNIKQVSSPKETALIDIIEEHEQYGRLVVYAGFTASVDRVCKIFKTEGWEVSRLDGRGWEGPTLQEFQKEDDRKIGFVGQPGAGGMGITLTASPTIVYWSNDFNAESRIQSEDRIHRIGTKGATIVDLIHLQTDILILDNLQAKRKLQDVSLGQLKGVLDDNDAQTVVK